MTSMEVRIESIYPDPDESEDWPDAMEVKVEGATPKEVTVETTERSQIYSVTLELDTAEPPGYFAGKDEWDEWAEENIFPFTGIGKNGGESGYFAEITECPSDEDGNIVGRTFEWGV